MSLRSRFEREVAALGLPRAPAAPPRVVTEEELAALPDAARRYLRFMGVPGRPRNWSFRAGFRGRFRRGEREPWMRCEAWQYDSAPALARVMLLRIRAAGIVPIVGRDSYLDGRGRMRIEVLGRFPAGDGTGFEYDLGELVTLLNDAVLMAPSMLLRPEVRWSPVDRHSFDVAITDHRQTATARVLLDERGAPRDFVTTDRFMADPDDPRRLTRARWSTPVAEWTTVEGRPVPASAGAVWHLETGDFTYAELRLVPGSAAFDVPPGG